MKSDMRRSEESNKPEDIITGSRADTKEANPSYCETSPNPSYCGQLKRCWLHSEMSGDTCMDWATGEWEGGQDKNFLPLVAFTLPE